LISHKHYQRRISYLFGQGARSITLKISHDALDEGIIDGHLNIEILEIRDWQLNSPEFYF